MGDIFDRDEEHHVEVHYVPSQAQIDELERQKKNGRGK